MPYAPQVQQHAPPVPTQHQARFASSAPVLHQVQYAQQAPVQPQVPYAQQAPGQPQVRYAQQMLTQQSMSYPSQPSLQNLPQVASQPPSGPGQVHVTPLVQQPSNSSGLSGYTQVSTSAGPTNNGGTANGMKVMECVMRVGGGNEYKLSHVGKNKFRCVGRLTLWLECDLVRFRHAVEVLHKGVVISV
ncbi:hypothetical protein GQ600_9002 [Phytophthora cactorum]|nr:hypothetical protein GQ600_9002 [Phytophthora cactorum]